MVCQKESPGTQGVITYEGALAKYICRRGKLYCFTRKFCVNAITDNDLFCLPFPHP